MFMRLKIKSEHPKLSNTVLMCSFDYLRGKEHVFNSMRSATRYSAQCAVSTTYLIKTISSFKAHFISPLLHSDTVLFDFVYIYEGIA